MKADSKLMFSCEKFHETLVDYIPDIDPEDDILNSPVSEPYPSLSVLAQFASIVYTDVGKDSHEGYEKILELPGDWKLLTTACNNGWRNGYFGVALWSPSLQQVVVSHRGTNPTEPGAMWTNMFGVVLEHDSYRMMSAITFVERVKNAIHKATTSCKRFHLSVTGHSLGGWLASISGFSVKYLRAKDGEFIKSDELSTLHTHVVAFDSPGCKSMLDKIADTSDYRYRKTVCIETLDISNYFSAPNRINTYGLHAGCIYRVMTNVSKFSKIPGKYTLAAHDMNNLLEAFKSNSKVYEMKDWPISHTFTSSEYKDFHREVNHASEYHFNPGKEDEYNMKIRYQPEGSDNSGSLRKFSDDELKLLQFWTIFKKETVKTVKMQTFLTKHSLGECKTLFDNFAIDMKNRTITCDSKESLEMVVKRAKLLVRWFREELMEAVDQQSGEIPAVMYSVANQTYLDSLPECRMNFRDTIGLRAFLESDTHRILNIETEDSELEMSRLYNVFCQLRELSNCQSLDDYMQYNNYTFIHWKHMATLGRLIDCDNLREIDFTYDNLLIIDCSSSTDTSLDLGEEKMFTQFMINAKKKLILVSPRQSDSENFLKSFDVPVKNVSFKHVELTDLTEEAQNELFTRKMLTVGREILSLADYAGIHNFTEFIPHINSFIDSRRLKSIVTDQNYSIELKDPLLSHSDLLVHSALNRRVSAARVAAVLKEHSSCALLVISGAEQQETRTGAWGDLLDFAEADRGTEGRVTTAENAEPLFKQLCRDAPDKKIYWLDASAGSVRCKQMYENDFYMGRKFNNRIIFDSNNREKFLIDKNVPDIFIFQNVVSKLSLKHFLSPVGSEEDFLKRENIQTAVSTEQVEEIARRNYDKPVHVFKYEGFGGSCLWLHSRGSLEGLRPYVTADTSEAIDEGDLCRTKQKVVIIADDPGMGKSTSLTSVSRLLNPAWVIRITLKDFSIPIRNLPPVLSLRSVTEFLLEEKFTEGSLPHGLLEFCLQHGHSRQVYLLFDGFDEIKEDSSPKKINTKSEMLRLLQYLKNETTAIIWVTTRLYLREMLENGLAVFATRFQKISEVQQRDYILKFWRSHLVLELDIYGDAEGGKLAKIARDLYREVKVALGTDVNRFMGILLQTRMLAEVFMQSVKDNIESQAASCFKVENVLDLYQKFVNHKYDIYLNDKTTLNVGMSGVMKYSNIEQITEKHRMLAIFALFPKFAKENFDDVEVEWKIELSRVGLVCSGEGGIENIEFTHRTLAEYFCAHLVVHWLYKRGRYHGHAPMMELLLTEILLQDSYKVTRTFINRSVLSQPLTKDADKFNAFKISELWQEKQHLLFNQFQDTALHVSVEEENDGIVDILIGGLKCEPVQKALIAFVAAHNRGGDTALGMAAKIADDNESSEIAKLAGSKIMRKIVQSVATCPFEVILELLLATYIQSLDSDSEKIRLLTNYLKGEEVCSDIKKGLIRTMKIIREVLPFLAAVKGCRVDDVRELYSKLENEIERHYMLLATDDGGSTVLHLAAQDRHDDEHNRIQTQIIRIVCNHNFPGIGRLYDSRGETPLHCAGSAGRLDIVEHLVNHGVNIDSLNLYGETALSAAAYEGHYSMVQFLLEKGADVNSTDNEGSTPLSRAAERGHLLVVEFLEKKGADIQFADKQGSTPLSQAAAMGRLPVVELLMKKGAKINCTDKEGNTPLSEAAEGGCLPVVEFLVEKGAEVNIADNSGWSALSRAAEMGHLPVVKFLVKKKADISSTDPAGCTALSRAAEAGRLSIVEFLVENGADIYSTDKAGQTAYDRAVDMKKFDVAKILAKKQLESIGRLQLKGAHSDLSEVLAVLVGQSEIFEFLIKKGADVNSVDTDGRTALSRESKMGHLAAVEFLVENGADINLTDREGCTALSLAAYNRHILVVEFLMTNGADINSKDMAGWAALSEAAKMGQLAVTEFLNIKGADINSPDIEHWSTLFLVAMMELLPVVKFLIERGMDINSIDNEGWTILSRTSKMGKLPVVKFLVEMGADINYADVAGWTALARAAEQGRLAIVEYLVEKGACINSTDLYGNTLLCRAAEMGHLPVLEFLVENGADINSMNRAGWTALSIANKFGRLPIMEFLVDKGADIDPIIMDQWPGMPNQFWQNQRVQLEFLKGDFFYTINDIRAAMYRPTDMGYIPVMEFLEEEGVDIDSPDLEGETALTRAANSGYLPGIMFLVEKGASIDSTNNNGSTALLEAAKMGHLSVVEFLVEKGANINHSDGEDCTALSLAACSGYLPVVEFLAEKVVAIDSTNNERSPALLEAAKMGHLPVVEFLAEKGANINFPDGEGWTALFHAARDGHLQVVEFLVEKGAVIDSKNNEGSTALSEAAKTGHLSIVNYLVKKGAGVNSADENGWTALFQAAHDGHLPVVEFLVEKEVDMDSTDKEGRTVLNLAVCNGHLPMVELLLQKGADIDSTDEKGRTALYRAAEMGFLSIVKFLVESGANIHCADRTGNTALSRAIQMGRLPVVHFLEKLSVSTPA